jgi:hypothetical protein
MDTSKDRRHLEQIERCLASPPQTIESLGRLVAELETLSAQLETTNEAWKLRFQDQWATLEEVFAVALDRRAAVLDKEGTDLVTNAFTNLGSLVNEAITGLSPDSGE